MKMLKMKTLAAAVVLASGSMAAQAAPIATDGTLSIDMGAGSAPNIPCPSGGSCFGMEVAPGFVIWTDFGGGTDGGIIVGKNQASGGQENAPSPTNITTGELTTAWLFFSNYGTFTTPAGTTNVFDDASCAGASCVGATDLNSWNVAWNGVSVPMGSGAGCNSLSCSADQLAGIFITDYTMAAGGNGAYSISYGNVVPDGDLSGFGNVKFSMVLRGTATNVAPPTATFTPTPTLTATFTPTPTTGPTATFTPTPTTGPTATFTPTPTTGPTATFTPTVTPTFTPTPTTAPLTCAEQYPLSQVSTIGGGQSPSVNGTMTAVFVGHITTTRGLSSGGKNAVKICPGTVVEYEVTSSVGTAHCTVQSAATASAGTLSLGDKMICTNKPDGSDTDRFSIKSGI